LRAALPILLILALLPSIAHSQSPSEQTLLNLTNRHRAEHNLPPLAWDPILARAALIHAQRVAREPGPVQHQYPGEPDLMTRAAMAGSHFSSILENVAGQATTPAQLDQAWMASPSHRADILNPNANVVGIAVVENQGLLYAVQDFARITPSLAPAEIERRVSQLLLDHGLAPAPSNADARATCPMHTGNAGNPLLVIQWDGADLAEIPALVLHQVPNPATHTAAVANCASQRPTHLPDQPFTTYRVVILIY
jgi:Cysteine-rich secretory protein family